jgi:hypothetical protein
MTKGRLNGIPAVTTVVVTVGNDHHANFSSCEADPYALLPLSRRLLQLCHRT